MSSDCYGGEERSLCTMSSRSKGVLTDRRQADGSGWMRPVQLKLIWG